jgi:rod shape-determining protein MreC
LDVRHQGRYRTPLLVALALLLVFSLLSLSLKHSPVLKKVQGTVVASTAPGLEGIGYVARVVKHAWLGYFYLVGVEQENHELKRQLQEYKQRQVRYQEAQEAMTRLEALLDLKRQVALPVIGARVIAYDPSLWSRSAIIDQGQAQGVKEGQPVLAPQGIVGRIVAVYSQYSKVMLIVDRKSAADAMVQRTRVRGILKGKGGNRCSLDYVPKNADIKVGDLVLASGLVGLYPKGLVFGKVTQADKNKPGLFQAIEVAPSADLSALEEVLVVKVANLALSEP